MKKSTLSLPVLLGIGFLTTILLAASPGTLAQKIDILGLAARGDATLTATTWDLGNVNNCFDGDIYTMMRSANINPAFVQVAFTAPRSVKQIRVLLGEPDYPDINNNSWWVEVADDQADMDTQSGSYQLVVPRRDDVNGIWDQTVLSEAIEAKIWKFTVERTVRDDYVHIPELQLWSGEDHFPDSDIAGFQLMDANTDQFLMGLTNGTTVNNQGLSESLAIEVLTDEPVGSVKIKVDGPGINTSKNESAAPYASFGDDNGDFDGKSFQVGTYTVTATPYSGRNATGTPGTPAEISFTLSEDDNQSPVASFTAMPDSGPVPLTVAFDASASSDPDGQVASYHYDFGDGNSDTGVTTSHTYTSQGQYTVTLTVTDNEGATGTATKVISVGDTPAGISFRLIDADTDQAISGLTNGQSVPVPNLPRNLAVEVVTTEPVGSFKIQIAGPGLSTSKNESAAPYASFGDDNGDFEGRMLSEGQYTVTATPYSGRNATGEAGTPAQISFTLSGDGNQPPVASFTAVPDSGPVPLTVAFDASASSDPDGQVASYHYDFGDGNSATTAQASHTYTSEGQYTVTLTVTDNEGATGTATQQITVTEGGMNLAPTASLIAEPTSGSTSLSVEFDASGSMDSDGQIVSYTFDYGDGRSYTTDSPVDYHTYRQQGEYTATVTVTDNEGATATASQVITVENFPGSNIASFRLIDAEQDEAIYDWDDEDGYFWPCILPESMGIEVIPSDAVGSIQIEVEGPGISTSMIENGAPYSSFGDDGDDIFGMEFSEGTYLITATAYSGRDATGTAGVPAETELTIELESPGNSNFTATPASGSAPLEVVFEADIFDPVFDDDHCYFDFGDGTAGITTCITSHTYTEPGTYTVTHTISSSRPGCSSSTTKTITVAPNPSPVAGFRLIDADTDQPFADITQGTEIDTYQLPGSLAIEALVSEPVGSLKIEVTGPGVNTARNQSDAPYSSFGDSDGDFAGMPLGEGDISYESKVFTVKATPYSGRNATGTPGIPLEITFSIVEYGTFIWLDGWLDGITGTQAEGEYAHYNFYVNGELQFDRYYEPRDPDDIHGDFAWTEVPISEIESVMVEFDNDLQTATEDRNLHIGLILLETGDGWDPEYGSYYGVFLDPLDEGVVYDRGALDGVDVVPGTNVMDVNGFMIFPVETSDLARYGPRVTKPSPVAETTFSEPASSALEEGSLLIYPNPARGQVEVNLPLSQGQPYTLQLYDLYGREVFRQQGAGSVTESIPLQGQPRGTYLVAVQTGGQRLVQKLLITD